MSTRNDYGRLEGLRRVGILIHMGATCFFEVKEKSEAISIAGRGDLCFI
jgi:hypothetical protein